MIATKNNKLRFAAIALAVIFLLGVSAGSLWAAGSGDNKTQTVNATEQPLKIRIGVDAHEFSYQFRVALRKDIFKKYNIDAEIFTFSYGIDTVNAAILGETDSAEAMDFALASRFASGNKLRVVSTLTQSVPGGSYLYVRNDAIKGPADIKGHRIGVQKATANEYTWGRFFEKWGIPPNSVDYVYLSSNAELLAAYQSNQIDAFWVGAELEAAVKEIPQSRNLGDNSLSGYLSRGYLLLDADFIAANPDGVSRFIKALDEATTFIEEHPDEVAQIAYQDLKIPVDAARKSINAYKYQIRLSQDDLDVITNVAGWAVDNGLIKNRYNIRDFVDLEPIRKALPERLTVK
jgi:NitT/TauT family transport system substrate-binding protein